MADLELAETSETAPSALSFLPRSGVFSFPGNFLGTAFVSRRKAIRWRTFSVVAEADRSKPTVHLYEDPYCISDAHTASLCALRDRLAETHGGSGFHEGELLSEAREEASYPRRKPHQPVKGLSASLCDPFLPDAHSASPLAVAASLGAGRMLSNQGGSSGSGSGGRAGGERNGGVGDGNQGIGGGGEREGIGNERRGNRGRNHGGGNGNGDDDGNDRGGWVGYIEGERGPMGPGPYGLAEILSLLNAAMIGALESVDIHGLPARAMIYRVVSLGFNSVALVCLPASIGQRRTSPRLASMLCLIACSAILLGFISMIAMAISASFIP